MKKVDALKKKREGDYIMKRLRKAIGIERKRDVAEVKRDIALIKSPAIGLKRAKKSKVVVSFEDEHEKDRDEEETASEEEQVMESEVEEEEEEMAVN